MRFDLTNDFHNTATYVHAAADGRISERAARRLCMPGCTCSAGAGTRGRQPAPKGWVLIIDFDGPDGGAVLHFEEK